jgi:hypothetical protein
MKILNWIRNLFRPKPANAAADELRRVDEPPDVTPSETPMSQTHD